MNRLLRQVTESNCKTFPKLIAWRLDSVPELGPLDKRCQSCIHSFIFVMHV